VHGTRPMPRVLIVDDGDAYRSVMREHLSRDYQIIETACPEEALVMAVENGPDVSLLDLSMPGLPGFELCQTLSSLSFTQKIPIFIISGQDERNKAFCQNLGALRLSLAKTLLGFVCFVLVAVSC
jgi:CheY-like chemotaxis protein